MYPKDTIQDEKKIAARSSNKLSIPEILFIILSFVSVLLTIFSNPYAYNSINYGFFLISMASGLLLYLSKLRNLGIHGALKTLCISFSIPVYLIAVIVAYYGGSSEPYYIFKILLFCVTGIAVLSYIASFILHSDIRHKARRWALYCTEIGVILSTAMMLYTTYLLTTALRDYPYVNLYDFKIFMLGVLPTFSLILIVLALLLYLASFKLANNLKTGAKNLALYLIGAALIALAIGLITPSILSNIVPPQQSDCPPCTSSDGTTACICGIAYKPVIYLYPEESMPVNVNVELVNGYFTKTDPALDLLNGWEVIASPDGKITWSGKQYPYLFYEAATSSPIYNNEGWVVPRSNISKWFEVMLPKMGLNEKEKNDFTEYWNQYLPTANYYNIKLLNEEELNSSIRLNIRPKPDTVIRVILMIEKLDKPIETTAPAIVTPERSGFTAVEWGVILSEPG